MLNPKPVMQIHFDEKNVKDPTDEDHLVRKRFFFIRRLGFTALQLLSLPWDHELFTEDPDLKQYRAHIVASMNARLTPLILAIFPEEDDNPERINKAIIMRKFFKEHGRKIGEAPCGISRSWTEWTESPGGAASKLWYILLALTSTVRLQMERSGNQKPPPPPPTPMPPPPKAVRGGEGAGGRRSERGE